MLLNILKQINWVDIFILVLIIRVCYVAAKNGFPIELFKLGGTILAIYLSCHYFALISVYLSSRIGSGNLLPLEFLEFIIFVLLAITGYGIFLLLRSIFNRFIKMEAVSGLNKWGSLLLGVIRGLLLASLIMFMMFISSIGYFKNSVRMSYSGKRLALLAPRTYAWFWSGIVSKFAANEKFNDNIAVVNEEFLSK